ncbi:hypothetical protein B0T17DRAFT_476286, partial [Bombardia bombarda]
ASEERNKILDWLQSLTPINFAAQQSDFINRRQAGTGQWLLESPLFCQWVENQKQTLFCPGIPGAGKTMLTAIVVDELAARFHDKQDVGLAVVYCNFRQHDQQTANHLVSNILKQLAESQSDLPTSLRDLYKRHIGRHTQPSIEEISTTLSRVAEKYTTLFVAIDALDE